MWMIFIKQIESLNIQMWSTENELVLFLHILQTKI